MNIVTERAIPGYKFDFASICYSRAVVHAIAWLGQAGDRWKSQLSAWGRNHSEYRRGDFLYKRRFRSASGSLFQIHLSYQKDINSL